MLSSNYKHLYAKYKSKYLKLKKQLGGSRVFYQPCEINRLTTGLFINNDVKISLRLLEILQVTNAQGQQIIEVPINSNGSARYCQDPAILLKLNGIGNENNYAISVSNNFLNTLDLSSFNQKIDVPATSSNDFGGNFITSPESTQTNPYGSIFCFSGIGEPLLTAFGTWCMQNLVQLQCDFRNQGERHIDECMCFMPYGPGLYKIWIYQIRNITLSTNVQSMMVPCTQQQKIQAVNSLDTLSASRADNVEPVNQIKSGNFNNIPPRIKNRIEPREYECLKQIYNPDPRIAFVSNLQGVWHHLETQRQGNLETIARNIFSKSYAETSDYFVSFPLDLQIDFSLDGSINYKITNVPIFNRVWYETATNVKVLFSVGDAIDPDVQRILTQELPHVKSMDNPAKPISYHFINTSQYNEDGRVGGNLHCLIKSVL